jgi:hypothetical protein
MTLRQRKNRAASTAALLFSGECSATPYSAGGFSGRLVNAVGSIKEVWVWGLARSKWGSGSGCFT